MYEIQKLRNYELRKYGREAVFPSCEEAFADEAIYLYTGVALTALNFML